MGFGLGFKSVLDGCRRRTLFPYSPKRAGGGGGGGLGGYPGFVSLQVPTSEARLPPPGGLRKIVRNLRGLGGFCGEKAPGPWWAGPQAQGARAPSPWRPGPQDPGAWTQTMVSKPGPLDGFRRRSRMKGSLHSSISAPSP